MKKLTLLFAALMLTTAGAFAQCDLRLFNSSSNTAFCLFGGTLTIGVKGSGAGVMTDWTGNGSSTPPWYSTRERITNVVVQNGVTHIGSCAFMYSPELTSATIAPSVRSIGGGTFMQCSKLTSVIIAEGVKTIGSAFQGCTSLPSITIPSTVTTFEGTVFANCKALTSITIYAKQPPTVSIAIATMFLNLTLSDITLYVPAESIDLYQAKAWKKFNIVATSTVTPSDNGTATITWQRYEQSEGGYRIVIYSDAARTTAIRELVFDAAGNLISDTNLRSAGAPFSYMVTGLDGNTKYFYTLEYLGAGGAPLFSTDSEFTTLGSSTGTNNTQAALVTVSPNPTTGIVNISQEAEIKVYTPQGALLLQTVGNQVNLSAYPQGVYFLQIDGQPVKVIKQ